MKFHQYLTIVAVFSIFFIPGLKNAFTPKYTPEQYNNLMHEAIKQGNYLRTEELSQDMSRDYKGEMRAINAKGYLFNLYQGKCGGFLSNGFPHPIASNENLLKCKSLTNMQKATSMAEELVEDLEDYLNSDDVLSTEDKEWIYGQISFLAKGLSSSYSKGEYINKSETKALKYQKLDEKYQKLRQ